MTTRCFSKCARVRRVTRGVTSTMALNVTELLTKDYRVFFFLFDRQAAVRRSSSVASYAASRGGLMVDYGRWTNERSDNKL